MKLPRDLGGEELVVLLGRYGYAVTRQTGSHMRAESTLRGFEHHVTIPRHPSLRAGTLSAILHEVAAYLEIERHTLVEELFS